jgi:lipoate-protein ligase A
VRWLEAQGLPVFQRIGGGAAVLLDDGCLSFFAAIPSRDLSRLDENFRTLTLPVRRALARLGVPAGFGRAPGSFCEGPQDLVTARGRKIAGVAQALRRGYALVSGMVLVRQDPYEATAILQEFYRRAGSAVRLRASAVTSLAEEMGRAVDLAELQGAIALELAGLGWDSQRSALRPHEAARAEESLKLRRFAPSASGARR